jgi:hypothetical protein
MDGTQPTYSRSSSKQSSLLSGKNIFLGLGAFIVILLVILAAITGKNKPSAPPQSTTTIPTERPVSHVSPPETGGSYANATNGFAFKYPPQFMATNVNSDIITVASSNVAHDPDAPATGLHITTTKGDNVMTKLNTAKGLFQSPVIKNAIVDGAPAKELSGNGKGMLSGKFVRFVEVYKNGETTEFAYFEGDPQFTPEIFNNILTSFKFTK